MHKTVTTIKQLDKLLKAYDEIIATYENVANEGITNIEYIPDSE